MCLHVEQVQELTAQLAAEKHRRESDEAAAARALAQQKAAHSTALDQAVANAQRAVLAENEHARAAVTTELSTAEAQLASLKTEHERAIATAAEAVEAQTAVLAQRLHESRVQAVSAQHECAELARASTQAQVENEAAHQREREQAAAEWASQKQVGGHCNKKLSKSQ